MINIYVLTMLLSALASAVSQLLLKQSARKKHRSRIFEYLNIYVIAGYGLLFATLVMNTWAYQGVAYKLGPVINATSYIFVLVLGRLVLKEKVTPKKILGVGLILLGICISAAF